MKIVYIAHPIGGNVDENIADLLRIIKHINITEPDIVPCAPYIGDVLAMDDSNPEFRARGIKNDITLIERKIFDECWLTGTRISAGMHYEVNLFNYLKIPVICKINEF